jgi:hypothetical protein
MNTTISTDFSCHPYICIRADRPVPYDAFGVFGATLPENIGVFHPSSLKLVPICISPNASLDNAFLALRSFLVACVRYASILLESFGTNEEVPPSAARDSLRAEYKMGLPGWGILLSGGTFESNVEARRVGFSSLIN